MLSLIEALNFRSLRYIRQPLQEFHALVGPNASGKTTFLDVVAFLGQLVAEGPEAAIWQRTENFDDLTWKREGGNIELAIEARLPESVIEKLPADRAFDSIRYVVQVGYDQPSARIGILEERVSLFASSKLPPPGPQSELFPHLETPPAGLERKYPEGRVIVSKAPGGNDNWYSEVHEQGGKGWAPSFKLGPFKSALGNLPADENKFPASAWLQGLLSDGVQSFVLNSQLIRRASPPGQGRRFRPDGSNLPWMADLLTRNAPERYRDWIAHLQTALPDLLGLRVVERPDDRHRYLMLQYRGDIEVPSWTASDGTLRLLALTLPAYLPDFSGVYLIEEPENGIHPLAVETMIQSLSSVYDAQILLATHSTVVLSVIDPDQVLCFAKTAEGATDVVLGSEHPRLQDWRGQENFSVLFAAGVLG